MLQAQLLTPPATGAIAVIAVRGEGVRAVIAALTGGGRDARVTASDGERPIRRVKFVRGAEVMDDGLVVAAGEDAYELHLHGGVAVIDAMFAALGELGVRRAAGAAAKTVEEEVERALPLALTETGVRLLAHQPAALRAWVDEMTKLAADAPWKAAARVQWMRERSRTLGQLLRPARVAIVGPPNAGKSTLANALLGRTAAIASDVAGTTRDWVDAPAVIAAGGVSVPVTLVDTAGIRETADEIERESIRRTHEQVRAADVAVAVFDAAVGVDESVMRELAGIECVVVMNKSDLGGKAVRGSVRASAVRGEIGAVMEAVLAEPDLGEVDAHEPFVWARRQWDCLERAEKGGAVEMIAALNELLWE